MNLIRILIGLRFEDQYPRWFIRFLWNFEQIRYTLYTDLKMKFNQSKKNKFSEILGYTW